MSSSLFHDTIQEILRIRCQHYMYVCIIRIVIVSVLLLLLLLLHSLWCLMSCEVMQMLDTALRLQQSNAGVIERYYN